jgi:hypothetical protein
VIGASAAVVCLGGLLAACAGGGDTDGYVAVDAPRVSGEAAPTGDVTFVPLDGETGPPAGGTGGAGNSPASSGDSGSSGNPGNLSGEAPGTPETSGSSGTSPSAGSESGRTPVSSPSPTPTPTPTPGRTTPATLNVSDPVREPADRRWCEKVTLGFHNTGGSAVRSGTVTFGTHIIGALGVDWATVESTEELPTPIGPGVRKEKTWTVCVEEWRVPLGMHVETRDVDVRWK